MIDDSPHQESAVCSVRGVDHPNFVANPSTNVLMLYNTALESAQFVGPTYTERPLTVGVRAIHRW
jgi:hypothetical protein